MQIIVKNYAHVNRALPNWDTPQGRIVKSKAHYEDLIKQNNMISYEQAGENAKRNKKGKDYNLSNEAKEILAAARQYKNKDGSINLKNKPKLVEKMIKHGSIKNPDQYMKYLPAAYQNKGGFNA